MVINPDFPEPGYPGNPAVFQTRKPGFSGLAFLAIFNANDIFSKMKWIKKTRYVRPYFCYVVTSGQTDPAKHR